MIKQHTTEQPLDKEDIKREIKNYLETNENGRITYQNLGDSAKDILKGEFIVINAYIKKLN